MDNGQHIPSWFKAFLKEYRDDRDLAGRNFKTLTESINHLTEHVHQNSAEIHEVRLNLEQSNRRLDQTNRELVRTRAQSATLFRRLISEVKALRSRR